MADNQAMTYMAKIGVDGSEFTSGLNKMASDFTAFFGPTGIALGAIAVTAGAITSLIQEQGKLADSNLDLAKTTGIAVEEIQRFHYAAKLSGDSIGAVDSMLSKLTLSMGEARDATTQQAEAFAELGIDPSGKSTSEIFVQLAQSLTTMGDKQKASALAMDILGKSYKDSLPYMEDYLKNQKEIAAQEVFTKEQEESLVRGKEAFDKIGAAAEGFAGWLAIGITESTEELAYLLTHGQSSIMGKRAEGVDDFGSGATNMWSPDKIQTGIIDPYEGWTAAEVELQLQTDKVTQAQKDLEHAMTTGETNNPAHIAAVKDLSAAYVEQKQILTDLLGLTESVANQTINPYYDPGAIENQTPLTGSEIAAMIQNGNFQSGSALSSDMKYKAVAAAFQLANSSTDTSNSYLNQLRALSAEATSSTAGMNVGWENTSSATSISDRAMSALSGYQSSIAPVTNNVVVQVSPDFSESAQSIAEKTAEALSRELARQASNS